MLSIYVLFLAALASVGVSSLIIPINITSTAPQHDTTTVMDARSMTCFGHTIGSQLVFLHDCIAVTRKMITSRRSAFARTIHGTDCPMSFKVGEVPCEILLAASSEVAVDKFSLRVVALKAVAILEACGHGSGKASWGGMDDVGPKGLFRVMVTNPVSRANDANETGLSEEL